MNSVMRTPTDSQRKAAQKEEESFVVFEEERMEDVVSDSAESLQSTSSSSSALLDRLPSGKTHTLVLDIDETLLSVRRWIDEVQIDDIVLHSTTQKEWRVTKITKDVTLQYDNDAVHVYSFYFNRQQPFGQLTSSLDVGDRMDIGDRLASVKEVFTSYITINDGERDIELNCAADDYLSQIRYCARNARDSKFAVPDVVYRNTYLVRFRNGLVNFFHSLCTQHKELEIVLWTAAVRSVYTGLMREVHSHLISCMPSSTTHSLTSLWSKILFRDDCTTRPNGSYHKDLALLERDMSKTMMVDNIWFNFSGFEYNGLPVNEYWGHSHDDQLPTLTRVIKQVLAKRHTDVRCTLHQYAFAHDFSSYKLEQMVHYLAQQQQKQQQQQQQQQREVAPSSSSSQESSSSDSASSEEAMMCDYIPTQQASTTSASSSTEEEEIVSADDGDKHLDFYLFNFALMDCEEELPLDLYQDDDLLF